MNSSFKTKQNIADEYGICVRTLNRILEENNISVRRGHIPPKDQDRIFEILGKLPVKSK
jgi:hypothetical protein